MSQDDLAEANQIEPRKAKLSKKPKIRPSKLDVIAEDEENEEPVFFKHLPQNVAVERQPE